MLYRLVNIENCADRQFSHHLVWPSKEARSSFLHYKSRSFPLKISEVNVPKPQFLVDLVLFTEEIENFIFCAVLFTFIGH